MAYLALVRHGESEWNALDLWTGWTDVPLSPKGFSEARVAAEKLRPYDWDRIFESDLLRSKQTTQEIVKALKLHVPVMISSALRERDYGIYTGRNKLEVAKELGPEEYVKLRRGWDRPIPQGESLKQVYERVVPYFEAEVLPELRDGKNIIISASGNSLRALVKYLKKMSDQEIENYEIPTGEVVFISYPTP